VGSDLIAVVEIPKGSSNKYEWDDEEPHRAPRRPADDAARRDLALLSIYKTPEWKVVRVDGWYPREEALESIERAKKRFADGQPKR
jgi:inorganic pyrophosphatase